MKKRTYEVNRVTWIGLLVNVALTVVKLFAGVIGQSAAMIADAFHSLSDFATDIVLLFSFRIVGKPVDKSHDYGHGKYETLAAVFIGVALFATGVKICWSGCYRVFSFYNGQPIPQPGLIALYVAIISIIAKEWLYRYTIHIGRKVNSRAVFANAWHHKSDVFSSIGTLVGIGGAIALGERWRVLDPFAAVLVSFFILKTAVVIFREGIDELAEVSLNDETENKILDIVHSVPGVNLPHNLKTRKIGSYVAIDIHIKVDKDLNIMQGHVIATDVEDKLKKTFGEHSFISVHVEPL